MASLTRPALRGRFAALLASLIALALAPPAHALRVVDWNILNYPGSTGPLRAAYYRTVLDTLNLNADVIVTEEQSSSTGATEFLNEVLNTMDPPGTWAMAPFIDGNDTDAELYYRVATVQYLGEWAFYPNPANQLRLVHVYRLKPVGYTSADAEFRIYAMHLKASTGYESQRLAECTGVRDSMNAMPSGTRAMICGDMNFYTQAAEPGYTKLTESETNNIGRVYDMLPAGSWHDGATFAPYHTQSPCKDATGYPCASGAATGGMDDRFDMILPTYSLVTNQGLSAITGTMKAVGNDGLHLNLNITDSPTIPEGINFAAALKQASDHLPVRVDLQLPAMISTDASLAFGRVITGAPTQSQNLTISNPATAPADSLNCTFSTSSPFGAPGPLAVVAGGSAPATVTMSTGTVDTLHVNLNISSDAPDNGNPTVLLTGRVLDHAQASLDSLAALLADTLDFGEHASGEFLPQLAAVHNRGWSVDRARLSVNGAVIGGGGGGRFAIQGFTPGTLVSGTAARWNVTFDDAGATPDSTYEATLTFSSADETLPGAQSQSDLVITLRARVHNARTAPRLSAASQLDFGTVIVGATAEESLAISNSATPPADSLHYSFAAPAGFSAPAGTFALAAGDPPANHTIGMSTASDGDKSGTLHVNSDDPDTSSKAVLLSGTVLDHAQVSLDSLTTLLADTLDFGESTAGFPPQVAEVHNRGWTSLQARLSVSAAEITGGDGRFAIQGFTPGTLIAGTAGRWNVTFDEVGTLADSTYDATLTFSSGDESLPGAVAQPNAQYVLLARVRALFAVPPPSLPTVTRLYKPVPNPMLSATTLRFDLALPTSARLDIFDASGRRVATVADREFAAGSYSMRWDGRRDGGAVAGAGLYFVRLSGRGLTPWTVRLAIVR
jgi:hypothetical protein